PSRSRIDDGRERVTPGMPAPIVGSKRTRDSNSNPEVERAMSRNRALQHGSAEPTRRQMLAGVAASAAGLAIGERPAAVTRGDEVSRTEEAIHQEVVVNASPQRVYDALTETKQFERVVASSAAMKSGAPPGAAPTAISKEAGGAFTAFGGHIL